jgi:hypothetical protein
MHIMQENYFTSKAWHQEVSLRAKVGVEAKEGAIASGRLG